MVYTQGLRFETHSSDRDGWSTCHIACGFSSNDDSTWTQATNHFLRRFFIPYLFRDTRRRRIARLAGFLRVLRWSLSWLPLLSSWSTDESSGFTDIDGRVENIGGKQTQLNQAVAKMISIHTRALGCPPEACNVNLS